MSDQTRGQKRDRLSNCVDQFCKELAAAFKSRIERNPKGFKRRVLALVGRRLPPFAKPPGRPRLHRVTAAVEAYRVQKLEVVAGCRSRIDWLRIARECDRTFISIRSEYRRRVELKRLRDAVHARVRASQAAPWDK